MHAPVTVTQSELPDFLLHVALRRPVFVWGAPGIGKSSLVREFATSVGLPCVTLLGSQLAPEDLMGVPQIIDGKSRFCPPRMIARDDPYCLFLDELNACSHEVQKAFYSLILDRRVGEYEMPAGSVVIGAGNRSQDAAIVRGLLPAGLVEEIRALAQPPIAWEVELARWFDGWIRPQELRRTYARASRRQQATPDIPRPRTEPREMSLEGRTFGVVIDTSGSMSAADLGRALGAVASYGLSRDVVAVRVIFCDAAAHDAGWLSPDDIAGRVRVKGRGGTVLQPGVDLLLRDEGFPKDGPLLVVTDGACDVVRVPRAHAFLLTGAGRLPFTPVGPVFRMS